MRVIHGLLCRTGESYLQLGVLRLKRRVVLLQRGRLSLHGHNLSLQVGALSFQLFELTPQGRLLSLQRGILGKKGHTHDRDVGVNPKDYVQHLFWKSPRSHRDISLTHIPLHLDESVFDFQQFSGGFMTLVLPFTDSLRVIQTSRGRAQHHPLLLLPLAQRFVVFLHLERESGGYWCSLSTIKVTPPTETSRLSD